MTKQTGLGDNLYVAGYDLSGDISAIGSISGSLATIDATAINQLGMARLGGKRDGQLTFTSFFNPASDRAHPVLSVLPTTDVLVTYCRGTTLGSPAASLVAKQVGYDPTRAEDGAFTMAVSAQANGYGLEWGKLHTAGLRTDTGITDGASVDGAAQTTYGLQAYLQVTDFVGTDATIAIEESSDDGSTDPFTVVTGGAFTSVTAGNTTERIATSGTQTVERYLRVATYTSGGFSELTFCVMIVRNLTAVSF